MRGETASSLPCPALRDGPEDWDLQPHMDRGRPTSESSFLTEAPVAETEREIKARTCF